MAYTHQKYILLKNLTLENYQKIGHVYCPYFHEYVHFNNKGIEHLLFRDKINKRPESDQYIRMKLLYLAPAIVSLSQTIQDYGTKIVSGKIAKYYIFLAMLNTTSVKVVVRQVGNGSRHFFSIIPNWKKNKFYISR
jgi:hypothetical protein